jgi:hypothetical protein
VDLATAAAVRLEGALGHRGYPVSNVVCWPYAGVAESGELSGCGHWSGDKGQLDSKS